MKASQHCISMIKRFEGLRTKAYCDEAYVWTIGYGHTGCVEDGDIITEAAADRLLEADVELFASRIDLQAQRDGITLSQNEFDALTDFAFNLGLGALFNSTLWKMLKENKHIQAANEFLKWDKSRNRQTGVMVVLPGLTKRRKAERELFLS